VLLNGDGQFPRNGVQKHHQEHYQDGGVGVVPVIAKHRSVGGDLGGCNSPQLTVFTVLHKTIPSAPSQMHPVCTHFAYRGPKMKYNNFLSPPNIFALKTIPCALWSYA